MKRSKKQREGLLRRIAAWDALPSVGGSGHDKTVRIDKAGTATFHKPGSQNARKGLGRRGKK